ncbi:unnamed protein product [Arabidopsis arenosa]|uniref:PGG domain-containing protein n=1 Tax=Arabidopsis arenosa TaxID=38785 RepID=A0A8S1ZN91_ARAAE|nr:unnamed protein product [Arabidopsis arenosa]
MREKPAEEDQEMDGHDCSVDEFAGTTVPNYRNPPFRPEVSPSRLLTENVRNGYSKYLPLSQAISHGNLESVRDFLDNNPDALTSWIDTLETPLLKACSCGQLEIVKELLQRMTSEQMLIPTEMESHSPLTPLLIAAMTGNLGIAEALVEKCPKLTEIPSRLGRVIPVIRAANAGHKEMTRFLYYRTSLSFLLSGKGFWAINLSHYAIFNGILDIASHIFEVRPRLVVTQHRRLESTPLGLLASKPDLFGSGYNLSFWQGLIYSCIEVNLPTDPKTSLSNPHLRIEGIYEQKENHCYAQSFLQGMFREVSIMDKDDSWTNAVHEAIIRAVSHGNKLFIVEMIKSNPELLMTNYGESKRNIFQLAVEFRKEKIFDLIYGLDDRKNMLISWYDHKCNWILHIAGEISPLDELSKVAGPALQMQRELQWFKEIESMVPDNELARKNKNGQMPREIFENSHREMRVEGEKWMKETAAANSFVAALIATVTFQAIFTVPGGTNDTSGDPLHIREDRFMVFIIADTLSFFASCTSVLIFLSILTARYSFDDFLMSLPKRLIWGLCTLFISTAALLVAFTTALFTSLYSMPLLVIPAMPLTFLPAVLFLLLQFPLLKTMISSTYGKGLFNRDTTRWF